MRVEYKNINFREETLDIITQANDIIEDYLLQGFTLTLRQLYYQFVAKGLIPNTEGSYKRLGSIINDARMAGMLDWSAIEDRTRWLRELPHWDDPTDILKACAKQYRIDLWRDQKYRPEVWIEKDALIGVIEKVCNQYDVPFFACRGYMSQSEQWRAGQRFDKYLMKGQCPVVYHLGDHDPSGIDMTRDNQDRLTTFTEFSRAAQPFPVIRLALNMNQVQLYSPPPNPTKLSDSRSSAYVREHGTESWELDALEPVVISNLIENAITTLIDEKKWKKSMDKQKRDRAAIKRLAEESKA